MNKIIVSLACVLAGSVMGCNASYGFDYDVVIDPNFSQEDQLAVMAAAHNWEVVSDSRLHMHTRVGKFGDCANQTTGQICVWASSIADIVANGGEGNFIGFTVRYDGDYANVYIPTAKDTGYDFAHMVRIITHETGHALGLSHEVAGNVMCNDMGCSVQDLTCDDYAQFAALRGVSSINKTCPKGGQVFLSGN